MQMFCLALSPLPPPQKQASSEPERSLFHIWEIQSGNKIPPWCYATEKSDAAAHGRRKWPKCPSSFGWGVLCGENRAAALLLFFLLRTLRDRTSGYPLRGRWGKRGWKEEESPNEGPGIESAPDGRTVRHGRPANNCTATNSERSGLIFLTPQTTFILT